MQSTEECVYFLYLMRVCVCVFVVAHRFFKMRKRDFANFASLKKTEVDFLFGLNLFSYCT